MGIEQLNYKTVGFVRMIEEREDSVDVALSNGLHIVDLFKDHTVEQSKEQFIDLFYDFDLRTAFEEFIEKEGIEAVLLESIETFETYYDLISCIEVFNNILHIPIIFAREKTDTSEKLNISELIHPFHSYIFKTRDSVKGELEQKLMETFNDIFGKNVLDLSELPF
ncbi:hypothetical protein [Falsibacillus pallidus]|uniref:Uncharacterized protein n=1 Tax=Falsibacillus pallidus TaxID=493781 RepID=A0A370G1C4_9BACI|nr:hypothetical protein [Falsibacillus pallidus]RDI37542.1 hypothetical protein DFR59_12139 [Falsibacillus pallidus]